MLVTGMDLAKYKGANKPVMTALAVIDANLNAFVKEIIDASVNDTENYYLKTGIQNNCYTVLIFNADKNMTAGFMLPLEETLKKCSDKTIEMYFNVKVKQAVLRFDSDGLHGKEVNWID